MVTYFYILTSLGLILHNIIGEGHDDINKKLDAFCQEQNRSDGSSSGGARGKGASGDKNGGSGSQELYEEWKCYQFEQLRKVGQGEDDDKLKGAGGLCILEKTNGEENGKKQKTFNNFFNFWVAHVLKDSIEWRNKLNSCINNGKTIRCTNKCKNDCKCYESWIQQKKTEWEQIEKHYEKEDFKLFGPYVALEMNLQDDYFPSIVMAYPGVKFVEEIKKIIEQNKGNTDVKKENNSITKLLEYEEKEATKCLDTHKEEKCKRKPSTEDLARSQTPRSEEDGNHSDEDSDEDEDLDEEQEEEVCERVKSLIGENDGSNEISGCNPKTGNFEWICGANQFRNNQEGPCMPPRRQKLCIHDLKVLTNTSSEKQLREAFINCAAKEIHFLWKKYKDDKKKEVTTGGKREETDKLQSQLKSGTIPEDFKRQMFYTFGDYRDLCLDTDISARLYYFYTYVSIHFNI
ncbi:hypothetical protein PFMALIP_05660 [Plasmodium falciparum MaliPS096_E11]|uniref:Uncharacterized protein n=1 Tax=Plasmodium falciparum MaliPS096_E11 TaxID=1036727 RepID=A0A024WHX7_PLAFA|nr:hypothetical protein PFMALIP_05660 [Plasmodium falciparum MaliPS096_E11]